MIEIDGLAAPEKMSLDVGYLRLTDAAPFIVASELDMFGQVGLNVALHQEVSWANIRDRLVSGSLDAAQMLAPLPAMSTLGVSGLRAPILTGLVLSSGGNAITLNEDLGTATRQMLHSGDARSSSEALCKVIQARDVRPTFATVHAFSTHTILLRRWLSSGGIDPDRDVSTIVVPPSQMVDSLETGIIDGYCVGEPWNTIATLQGIGMTVAMGQEIWPDRPEKVLAVSAAWDEQHPHTHLRLRLALLMACAWLSNDQNIAQTAQILSHPSYLDMPAAHILPSLEGSNAAGNARRWVRFFGTAVNRPDRGLASQMIEACSDLLGRPLDAQLTASLAEQTWRPDLYEQAIRFFDEHPSLTDVPV